MPADAAILAYVDTSVLVRSYVVEPGTGEAREILQRHAVVSSALMPLELASALRRLRRQRLLSSRHLEMIEARVRESRGFWTLLDLDGRVLQRAEDELRRGAPLRALTGDEQQRRAGLALGLDVVFVE